MSIETAKKAIDKDRTGNSIKKNWMLAGILFALITLLYGSVKMVYIAFHSQPECVPHLKTSDDNGKSFIAAKSSC